MSLQVAYGHLQGPTPPADYAPPLRSPWRAADEEVRLRTGLAQAGWTEHEIDARIITHKAQHENAPVSSPGVAAQVEIQLTRLCDDIEAAMTRRGLNSHARVARGVEPRAGPYASMTNVIMTRQGIVTVSSFMFRFCGLVARPFIRTLRLSPSFWESEDYFAYSGHRDHRFLSERDHRFLSS